MKLFWNDIGRQRFYVIVDSRLDYIYKCRAYELLLTNSITDRITTIDNEQLKDQCEYVEQVVKSFLKKAK